MQTSLWNIKPDFLVHADQVTTEIAKTNDAITLFHQRNVHAVKREQPPRHCRAVLLNRKMRQMLGKLALIAAVADIARAGMVSVKLFSKRRREDRVADTIAGKFLPNIDTVGVIKGPIWCDDFINNIHDKHS
jgi:hypothetical protein